MDSLDLATDVVVLDLVAEVGDSGVSGIVSTEDLDGLLYAVGLVDIVDCRTLLEMSGGVRAIVAYQ